MSDQNQPTETGSGEAPTGQTPPATPNGDVAGQQGQQTLTQEDVDRIAGNIRQKTRESTTTELLKQFDVEKVEDLQALVQAARDAEAANLSELERAQQQVEQLSQKAQQLEQAQQEIEQYQGAITSQLDALRTDLKLPEYLTPLLDKMSPVEQLNYITEHRKEFSAPKPKNLNAGAAGDQKVTRTTEDKQHLAAQLGIDPNLMPD